MRSPVLLVLMATTMLTGTAEAAELVLKRAVLGTGGVGYFEYAAEVTGKETLTLRARLDQVDDILKSVLILDPAGTGSATLPGKAGADETFASLPFAKSDLDSMPALIAALKGAEIRLSGPRKLEGRIASVQTETVTSKDGGTMTRTRVSVFSGAAIEQFILEEAEGLEFKDARLGEQVETALKALRTAQDRSGRDISIQLAEGGKRTVRIGYVAEAPVWKAAYRLTLPKADEDKARLQGWVVLENMTGNPWKDVEVTLSSASPVTFRQALYDPYYVQRQTIAPPVSRTALPRTDAGQQNLELKASGGAGTDQAMYDMAPAPAAAPAPIAPSARLRKNQAFLGQGGGAQNFGIAEPQEAGSAAEENAAGASFTLSKLVSVGSGESLTIPFVDLKMPSQAVAWYQGGSRNPWQALTLKNDGATSLPAGSATIYEGTEAGPLFSGEAQFPLLPTGDFRLIGFGADQKVLVDSEASSAKAITKIKVVDGTLQVESRLRQTTTYRVKNGAGELRHMVVEQPRVADWTLVEPKAEEATIAGQAYRIRFDVEAGKSKQYKVTLERPVVEAMAVADVTGERIQALMAAPDLDAETKARLATVAEAAKASDEAQAATTRLEEQRDGITQDQERIRENLKSAPQGSDLARLYSQKMLEQEKALDKLDGAIKEARAKYEAARKILGDRVRAL
ncbi:hypothetical protein BA190_31845 [Labrys sp. WJW]|uniref:DUF4139 domain-containing protein n=1 Tax=Labrys sp. WJW TaxID=1737983 RepID=UPI0008350BFD|nr:DUF4139 domain-containing protein [Labrys sp. WJW]OCC00901.1 hypothetical protein BA190_31845 [Labrys sp. WJW]